MSKYRNIKRFKKSKYERTPQNSSNSRGMAKFRKTNLPDVNQSFAENW
jgi:hypothetical protein